MTTYLAYAKSGKEFVVADEIRRMGLTVYCPRALRTRVIKDSNRSAVTYEAPYLQNYFLAIIPPVYWPDVIAVKNLIGRPAPVLEKAVHGIAERVTESGEVLPRVPGWVDFQKAVEAEYKARLAEVRRAEANKEAISLYRHGAALEILKGPFAGAMGVKFDRMVKREHDEYHKVRAQIEAMGQTVHVEIDPVDVRSAGG